MDNRDTIDIDGEWIDFTKSGPVLTDSDSAPTVSRGLSTKVETDIDGYLSSLSDDDVL